MRDSVTQIASVSLVWSPWALSMTQALLCPFQHAPWPEGLLFSYFYFYFYFYPLRTKHALLPSSSSSSYLRSMFC